MSNSTAQKPKQRPSQYRATGRSGAARKQTAHLEGRRDGTPLLFGWGSHLTRKEKTRIQTLAAYSFAGVTLLALIGVGVFGVVQQRFLIPASDIVKVNTQSVSQDTYRKQLAFDAQDLWNNIQKNITQYNALNEKLQGGDKSVVDQANAVVSVLQTQQTNFKQDALTQSTMTQLVEDQLLQQGAQKIIKAQPDAAKTLIPSNDEINKRLDAFKKAFPKGESYSQFLSKDDLNESDVRAAITVQARRDAMQAYLASQIVSPTRQIHARRITTNDQATAQKVIDDLKKQNLIATTASWKDIAKKQSVDPDTKDAGGDMGWLAAGGNDAGLEIFLFDSARKVGDLSPVLKTASGTFDVVQVLEIDPSRARPDTSVMQSLKDNALDHWLSGQKVASFTTQSTPDADAMTAARNLPKTPDLNAQLPDFQPVGQKPSK